MGTSEGMRKVWANPDHRQRRLENRRKTRTRLRHEKQEIFLAVFSETGVIKRAIEACDGSYSGYHHWMADDLDFAAKFKTLQSQVGDIASQHVKPCGVKPSVPRDTESQQRAKNAFLQVFEETGLISLASDSSGVPASQHRTWLMRDLEYASRFSELYEKTRLRAPSYWVTRPRMKAKQKVFLAAISEGLSPPVACVKAEIGRTLYRYWMSVDPEFNDEFTQLWTSKYRNNPTTIEIAVAAELTKRNIPFEGPRIRIDGYKYDVDLFVPHLKLNIEADGTYWHDEECFPGKKAHEIRRDAFLNTLGYNVLRLPEAEIVKGNWSRLDQELARLTASSPSFSTS
jgi:very-short-patch-repair endonuclease